MNLVTVWLLAAFLLRVFEPHRLQQTHTSQSLGGGMADRQAKIAGVITCVLVTVVLCPLLRGFVEVRYAQAISYSCTASPGPTYRIATPLIAYDGLPAT